MARYTEEHSIFSFKILGEMGVKLLRNAFFLILLAIVLVLTPTTDDAKAETTLGMLVYGEDGQVTPRYRLWDGSDLASSESSALEGESGHGEPYFMDLLSCTTRNEKILVEQTENGHIRAMIWNGTTQEWSLGTNAPDKWRFQNGCGQCHRPGVRHCL